MLIQFSVSNFRSIKDEAVISFVPEGIAHSAKGEGKFLTSAAIYGANASGKSNVILALREMRSLVLNRPKIMQSTDALPAQPFLLSEQTQEASTSFDIMFTHGGKKYRYGFDYDSRTVYSEYLYVYGSGKPMKVFHYDEDDGPAREECANIRKFPELRNIDILPNMLLLWECDRRKNAPAQAVLSWFLSMIVLMGTNPGRLALQTVNALKVPSIKEKINALMRNADFGIERIERESAKLSDFAMVQIRDPGVRKKMEDYPEDARVVSIKTVHSVYDESGKKIGTTHFSMGNQESYGTYKLFAMGLPIIDALETGRLIVIDEFDANIHPVLVKRMLELFSDPSVNTKNAQLLFVSQNTFLLSTGILAPSQIWFAEKDSMESTHLVSLLEYKDVKNSARLEGDYLLGKFGAVPYVANLFFSENNKEKEERRAE